MYPDSIMRNKTISPIRLNMFDSFRGAQTEYICEYTSRIINNERLRIFSVRVGRWRSNEAIRMYGQLFVFAINFILRHICILASVKFGRLSFET